MQHVPFKLAALIVHIGETAISGHYRSVLILDAARRYYTDDGRTANLIADAEWSECLHCLLSTCVATKWRLYTSCYVSRLAAYGLLGAGHSRR